MANKIASAEKVEAATSLCSIQKGVAVVVVVVFTLSSMPLVIPPNIDRTISFSLGNNYLKPRSANPINLVHDTVLDPPPPAPPPQKTKRKNPVNIKNLFSYFGNLAPR